MYSTKSRQFYGVVPANTQTYHYASIDGNFRISRLPQSDITEVIAKDPIEVGHLMGPFDVSLAQVLAPLQESVGIMIDNEAQVGSCTLISANLALIPCHCIEDMDIRDITAVFGFAIGHQKRSYKVINVLEYDLHLDYAIVQLEGSPGLAHGYPKLDREKCAYEEPALIHHPLGQPLKVSIHTFVHATNYSSFLSTFHDSDFGSSGGAYIDPSGTMIAMHLGSERNPFDWNLQRLALPIPTIISKYPDGILSRLTDGRWRQNTPAYSQLQTHYLPYFQRNFIDLETFDQANLSKEGWYALRSPTPLKPGIWIDPHQRKHYSKWPGDWPAGSGERFPLTLAIDEIVHMGERIPLLFPEIFDQLKPKNSNPNTMYFEFDKISFGKEIFKKLQASGVKKIGISATFNQQTNSWQFHFGPHLKKK